jgi:hypothetical protein
MDDGTRTLDEIYHELNELNTKAHEIILALESLQDKISCRLNDLDAASLAEEALKDEREQPHEGAAAAEGSARQELDIW